MLVMQRREGDVILIGDDIVIQILEHTKSRVKLGLVVPKSLPIVRGEVRKVGDQNRTAVAGGPTAAPEALAERLRKAIGGGKLAVRPETGGGPTPPPKQE